jgi:hypothetical protein
MVKCDANRNPALSVRVGEGIQAVEFNWWHRIDLGRLRFSHPGWFDQRDLFLG